MKCDCLNRCGDDPTLQNGSAEPCVFLIAQREQDRLQDFPTIERLVKQLHAAKGRFNTQVATCNLFDHFKLPCERPIPTKKEKPDA